MYLLQDVFGRYYGPAGLVTLSEADRSHLQKKVITNKAGRKQTVWVNPDKGKPTGKAKGKSEPWFGSDDFKKETKPLARETARKEWSNAISTGKADGKMLAKHLDALTDKELKGMLKELNQKVGGLKKDKVKRLVDAALGYTSQNPKAPAKAKAKPKALAPAKPKATKPKAEPKAKKDKEPAKEKPKKPVAKSTKATKQPDRTQSWSSIPEAPLPGKQGSTVRRQELRNAIGSSLDHLKKFREFRDGVIETRRLWHALKDKMPNIGLKEFHDELDALSADWHIELKTLNEVKDAKEPELAPYINGRMKYFVVKRDDEFNPASDKNKIDFKPTEEGRFKGESEWVKANQSGYSKYPGSDG